VGQFFGSNRFKFGLFGLNCSGGITPSRAPERWRADWKEIVKVAQLADVTGVEFLLPIAKWRGLGGEANMWGRSFETFTQAAALGALTRRIGVFVTGHVSLITPAFAAKAVATIDHATDGRAGLNIVCGWNPDEFRLHGMSLDGDHRYSRGLEWFRIYDKLLEGGPPFDWSSDVFDMRGLSTDPLPIQQPRPPVMSAAQSGDGQVFASQVADILFTAMYSFEQAEESIKRAQSSAAGFGRSCDVYVTTQFVCRPTRKQAEEYLHYYAVELADPAAIEYFAQQKTSTASTSTKRRETAADKAVVEKLSGLQKTKYPGLFPAMYPIVGSPDDIVADIKKLAALGIAGSTLVFLNYEHELPYFIQEVFPRMEKIGLRAHTVAADTVAGASAEASTVMRFG
jgi:alkanesulfonate monooxygenase SsuD/methylene tetrahydromethanopterin reductase-like flavin-dependent oxidoreductase (luciferase family)